MHSQFFRLTQLSTALALALGAHGAESVAASHWTAGLLTQSASGGASADGSMAVTSCLDDGGPGTLRSVVAAASGRNIIDMSGLTCSTITLTQGEISFHTSGLAFIGPTPDVPSGPPKLTIDAAYGGRAFYAADDNTGGTTAFANLRIANGSVSRGDYANGGCVAAFAGVYAIDTVFQNCQANAPRAVGGAIFAVNRVTLRHCTVDGNRVTAATRSGSTAYARLARGGGIYVLGEAYVYDSTISGNVARLGVNGNNAPGVYVDGGGIATVSINIAEHVVISSSTISGNHSDRKGGGLEALGIVLVRDSTISGNSAAFAGGMNLPDTAVTLQNSTVAFNSADSVGGVYCTAAAMTFDSTIISNNASIDTQFAHDLGHSPVAFLVSGRNNLITTRDASAVFASPVKTADPQLLPLADNGGPTMTHALQGHSPAIDAGNNVAGLLHDQRGYLRSVNGRADIGAYEWVDQVFADGFE